ncbi:hypothetical protein C6Y06_18575 [Bacillus sp. MZGC1]|nr:hypothetical protein C6Y06_18575 [Bacillus sp. MZGC1]
MFFYYLIGLIGVLIGSVLLSTEVEGSTFIMRFILNLLGMAFFVGSIWFVRARHKKMKQR